MSKARGVASGVGTALATIGKVGGVALGAAATGVGALTKSAIDSYGEFEQLAGGVDKLFGDASDTIMQYAIGAYKTSGLSANEYMQQATSFSASLINSLGGDTQKAAELADVAMRSMSDNWNTFGTDVSAVQNAYAGFAKQNYTMLDNLKLGYGGTKTEMERLIDDANDYAESIGESGDLSIDSFADIVQAIELVQKKQNIYGTTSKEAATTIQGSIGMTKASWQNFVTALGNSEADVGYFMDNLISSIGTAAQNILPVVRTALSGISSMIGELAPMIATELPGLITDIVPPLVTAAGQILVALGQGLIDNAPVLMQSAIDLILQFADYLSENADSIVDGAVTLIITLMNGLVENAPKLASAAIRVVTSFASAIVRNAPRLFEAAKTAIKNLLTDVFGVDESTADSFINTIQTVFDTVGGIIDSIKTAIGSITEPLRDVNIDWSALWNGMSVVISTVGEYIGTAIELIGTAIGGLIDWFVSLGEEANTEGTLMNDIWTGIQNLFTAVWDAIGAIIDTAITQFQSLMDTFSWLREQMDTEGTAINTIWQNIQVAISTVIDVVTGIINTFTALLTGDFTGAFESAKDTVETLLSGLGTIISNQFNLFMNTVSMISDNIKTTVSNKWESLKANVTAKVDALKTNIQNKWDGIKTNLQSKMDSIKTNMQTKWDSIKTNVSTKVDNIKTKITNTFDSVKTAVSNKFQAIKDAITNKLTAARDSVQNLIDAIKAKFNFSWSLPHLKMPHPYITGSFSLNPPSVPSFGISWYKKAMDDAYLLDGATIFGAQGGKFLGGGEAGNEIIVGESKLRSIMGADQIERAVQEATSQILAYLREILAAQNQEIVLDTGVLVGATASKMNAELGRMVMRGRGRW